MPWQRLRHNNNLRAIRLHLIASKYVLSVSKHSALWPWSRKSASVTTKRQNCCAKQLSCALWKKCMEARLLQCASKITGHHYDPVSCCRPQALLVQDCDWQAITQCRHRVTRARVRLKFSPNLKIIQMQEWQTNSSKQFFSSVYSHVCPNGELHHMVQRQVEDYNANVEKRLIHTHLQPWGTEDLNNHHSFKVETQD